MCRYNFLCYIVDVKWEIEFYQDSQGDIPVQDFICQQPPKVEAKIYRHIDLLQEFGLSLGQPYIEKLAGSDVWELKIRYSSNRYRILYFAFSGRKFILLHAFLKKTAKTPKNEIEIAQAQLSRNPDDVDLLNRLALAYNGLGQHLEAKKIINRAIEKNPDFGESFYIRAKIYEQLGQINLAVQDLKKAKGLYLKAGFIDNYLLRLKTSSSIPKDTKSLLCDTIVHLNNGRQIKGKFKTEREGVVFLDVLAGNSFGIIGINRENIRSLEEIN